MRRVLRAGKGRFQQIEAGWWLAALLPLIGILPTLGGGIPDTADGPLHVHRIHAMSVLLADGNFWPRWVPYFHLGFGYPIFNFYPPGVFYLGGWLTLAGLGAAQAFVALATLAWIAGTVGTYALARRMVPPPAALLSAALWAYAPSRLFEVWDQGSLPQMMAAALVPWLFYGLVRTAWEPARRHALLIAGALAGIALCHLPIVFITALYVAPAAVILPVWAARVQRGALLRRLFYTAGGLALGGGLAAIFVLPMALELRYVSASSSEPDSIEYFTNYFNDTFLRPQDVFVQPRPFDLTDSYFDMPITLGLVGGLLALIGLGALLRQRRYALVGLLVVALGFTVFMLLDVSLEVWLNIPFFRQLRYPERFLRVGAVWIALLGGASLGAVPQRWRNAALLAALVVVIVATLPLFYANLDLVRMDDLSALDEINFEMDTYIWGTTSYDELDPNWGEQIPLTRDIPEPDQYRADPLRLVAYRLDLVRQPDQIQAEEIGTNRIRVTVTEARPVRFHQYYYPGWRATLDGKPVDVYAEDEWGLLTVDVPPGQHIIELAYAGTTAQWAGTAITLVSLGLALALWITGRNEARQVAPASTGLPGRRLALGIAVGLVVVAFANEAVITPHTDWFRRVSPPDDPVYMEHRVDQPFGDAFVLLGYTLEEDTVAPGDRLFLTLYWRALRPVEGPHRSVVQVVNWPVTAAWAVSEPQWFAGDTTTPDRFFSEVHKLKIQNGVPPYVGRISVQLVDAFSRERLVLPDGSDRLLLDPLIRVEGRVPPVLPLLDYDLGGEVALRCASVERAGDQWVINLYWRVKRAPGQDFTVLVHGVGADGQLINQNDGPPLAGEYPPVFWRRGQILFDRHTLPADPAVARVAVGLYTPESRLAVTQDGRRMPDDRIMLPLVERSCLP